MAIRDLEAITRDFPEYAKQVEKHFKRNFILVALDSAFFTFSTALLSQDTVLPAYLNNLTSNPMLIGLIPAIFYLGYFLLQIISAYINQNTPKRKRFILIIAISERVGIFLIAISAQMTSKFSNSTVILFFFLAYSLYSSTMGLIMPAYSDFVSKAIYKKRGLLYGINQALGGVIGFVASLVATRILASRDFPENFRAIFWVSFAFSFISPIIISNFKETEFPIQPKKKNVSEFIKNIPVIIRRNPNLRKYVLTRQLIGLAMMGHAFFTIYAIQVFDLSGSMLGVFTMAILLSQSLSGILWGFIGDKFGYKKILIIGSILLFLEGLFALTVNHPLGFLAISGFIGSIYSAIFISHPNLIFEIAPPEETSLFIGLSNSLIAPITALAPILGGKIIDSLGYPSLFLVICAAAFGAFIISVFVFDEPRDNKKTVSRV